MRHVQVLIVLTAMAVIGLGCQRQKFPVISDGDKVTAEDDIREITFRHLFASHTTFNLPHAEVYFVSVGEKDLDPSDQFMARFAGHEPPVRKASQAVRGNQDDHFVDTEKGTGKKGIIFRIKKIRWAENSVAVAEVRGQYSYGMNEFEDSYYVEMEHGGWTIVPTIKALDLVEQLEFSN